jgi:hypothetical protein
MDTRDVDISRITINQEALFNPGQINIRYFIKAYETPSHRVFGSIG